MESILVIVGFLGAGKTTFLKKLTKACLDAQKKPYIIINDYENATLDAQQFIGDLDSEQVAALSGNCICCDGIVELRTQVNRIPARDGGITLIEANGTTDACELMGFLAVGLHERFLPPIQISLVDARYWRQREPFNELEANQVQVASLVILNQTEKVAEDRIAEVKTQIASVNPLAKIVDWRTFDLDHIQELQWIQRDQEAFDHHHHSHWSACSVDLKDPMSSQGLIHIMEEIPASILRVKGCTRLDKDQHYSFFERTPSGETFVREYHGNLISGPKLLVIGPGSDPQALSELVERYASV